MPLPVNRSTLSISDPVSVSVSFSNNAIGKAALEFSFQLVSQPFLAVKVAEILPVFNHHYVQSASAGLSDYLRMVLSHGAAAVDLLPFHSILRHPLVFFFRELFRFVVIRRRNSSRHSLEFALWRDMAPPSSQIQGGASPRKPGLG